MTTTTTQSPTPDHPWWEESEEENPLKVSPTDLLTKLEESVTTLDLLLEDLDCSPEDLAQTLDDPKTTDLIRLKINLAATQARLFAAQYAPLAVAKLIDIAKSTEKPEVARRASTTLIQIAGIPITTPATSATNAKSNPTKQKPTATAHRSHQELYDAACQVLFLKRGHDLNFANIPNHLFPAFASALHAFFQSHGLKHCHYQPPAQPLKPKPQPDPTPNTNADSSPNTNG